MAISISDIIAQNTAGNSEGRPVGVPTSYDWYNGLYKPAGLAAAPSGFTSVTAWGQVYQQAGAPAYSNPNAKVEVANAKTYVHLKATGEWVLVQDQAKIGLAGGHFVTDFSGNSSLPMQTSNSGGTASMDTPPAGHNDHFWPTARGTFAANSVDGVYVQMDMRVTDSNLHLIANIGADWWRSSTAPYVSDFSNNPSPGMGNWVALSTQWSTLGFYSTSTAQFQSDLPPTLTGAGTTPPVTTPDTVAPLAPKIVAFTPDTGTVGDKITTASVLTLSGTAEANSTVALFDGKTQIGTAKANASGAWSVVTSNLVVGSHDFTAKATDAAGNVSVASSALGIRVDSAISPPVTTPPVTTPPVTTPPVTTPPVTSPEANLLVNGSFEASKVAAGNWAGFSSIPGWTAITGGTIELWNNLNGVKATDGSNFGELDFLGARDGLYQDVKTVAGKSYDLSFDARSRPGFTGSTTTMEVLWNNQVIATVVPGTSGSDWKEFHFTVTGTGGQDRLTFREAAGQSADGLGALYDNVSLVPASSATTASTAQRSAAVTDSSSRALDLMTQYSATSFPNSSVSTIGGLQQSDASAALAQTLAKSH